MRLLRSCKASESQRNLHEFPSSFPAGLFFGRQVTRERWLFGRQVTRERWPRPGSATRVSKGSEQNGIAQALKRHCTRCGCKARLTQ